MKAHARRTAALGIGIAVATAALVPTVARAFCGFFVCGADARLTNNATMVVMMRDGTRTVLAMQNDYQGPPEGFALVIPVPTVLREGDVKTLADEVFAHVDQLAAPRLVEYWEVDPCYVEPPEEGMEEIARFAADDMGGSGRGPRGGSVRIEAQFDVGEYQIVILSADDSSALDTWLRENGYRIPEGAEPVLRPYVEAGTKFFVARVDPTKVRFENGRAMLSPLRFHYDSPDFSLPVRLGLLNSAGTQDLIVHVLAPNQRYDVANYPAVTIPTNLDVADSVREHFSEFYAGLFDRTLAATPRAVVTEYAWQATNCDPCPGPVLSESDLVTLGADTLPSMPAAEEGWERRSWMAGFVLTRLHARYSREALGEDLVFRPAPPIVGGREFMQENGVLEERSRPSDVNNFQGRYAIRHAWTGPIACADPVRNRWGGPPPGLGGASGPRAATDLAMAPRGRSPLESFLREDVPEIGITGVAAQVGAPIPILSASPDVPAPSAAAPAASTGGCLVCATGDAPGRGWLGALMVLGVLAWVVRRR